MHAGACGGYVLQRLTHRVCPRFWSLGVHRQLALFHGFGWLQETVEYILVADGQLDPPREEEEEEEEGHDEQEGDAMQEDQ